MHKYLLPLSENISTTVLKETYVLYNAREIHNKTEWPSYPMCILRGVGTTSHCLRPTKLCCPRQAHAGILTIRSPE